MKNTVRAGKLLTVGVALTLTIGMLGLGLTADASHTATVGLGLAEPFAILSGFPNLTNVGPTTITGDVGLMPAPGAGIIGLNCVQVTGTIYASDATGLPCMTNDQPRLVLAKGALTTAIGDAAGRLGGLPVAANELSAKNLSHGVYKSAAAMALSGGGTLTLNGGGDPGAVFIFQLGTQLTVSNGSTVSLINGAQSCHVFWQVDTAIIGTTATFVGTVLAATSITVANGSTIDGRLLAGTGNVTLINDTIKRSTCSTGINPDARDVVPTASPSPSGSPSPSPSASATPAPTSAPGASATPAPTGIGSIAFPELPSTSTLEEDMTFLILPILIVAFAVLYLVARARRRRAPPIA